MKSENSSEITMKCIVPDAVICLDPIGKRKLPCVIGNKADCLRCGCVIPFYMNSLIKFNQKPLVAWFNSNLNSLRKDKDPITIPSSF